MNLRIYRTFTWELACSPSEVRYGGDNPMQLVSHDELQYFDACGSAQPPNDSMWHPVKIVEAEKPESPKEKKRRERAEEMAKRFAEALPVDRVARTLASGKPVPDDYSHTELKPNGQQQEYIVLTAEERAKGFVRPVRDSYIHKVCGALTKMSREIAETYARDPKFYDGTFCISCRKHLPLAEFVWDGTDEIVGS